MAIRSSRPKATTVQKTQKKELKKSVAKKVTSKSPSVKKSAVVKKVVPLIQAPSPEQFWMNDGQILGDLVALAESFAAMDDLLFRYHVTADKNDFADWVESVLNDATCAQSLRTVDSPKKAHKVVTQRLRVYRY